MHSLRIYNALQYSLVCQLISEHITHVLIATGGPQSSWNVNLTSHIEMTRIPSSTNVKCALTNGAMHSCAPLVRKLSWIHSWQLIIQPLPKARIENNNSTSISYWQHTNSGSDLPILTNTPESMEKSNAPTLWSFYEYETLALIWCLVAHDLYIWLCAVHCIYGISWQHNKWWANFIPSHMNAHQPHPALWTRAFQTPPAVPNTLCCSHSGPSHDKKRNQRMTGWIPTGTCPKIWPWWVDWSFLACVGLKRNSWDGSSYQQAF